MPSKTEQQQLCLNYFKAKFENGDHFTSLDVAKDLDTKHETIVGILKSIEAMQKINLEKETAIELKLTPEGADIVSSGSPEHQALTLLTADCSSETVEKIRSDPTMKRGLAEVLKKKILIKSGDQYSLSCPYDGIDTNKKELISVLETQDERILSICLKKKWVTKSSMTIFKITPTVNFDTKLIDYITDIDKSMLIDGTWKTREFKPYNFNAAGIVPVCGTIHPLIETFNLFRNVLIRMGFSEMNTRRWVENSFWNFDTLFQPQTHAVRDAHDTFFLRQPSTAELPGVNCANFTDKQCDAYSQDYVNRVKQIHECGDDQSLGWKCPWKIDETLKLILRTHTTAVTSRLLRQIALDYQQDPTTNLERRFFSIDRVFRNETLDATHLAEFHQVEGVVASRTASLAELMGIIQTFFENIGIPDVKFKPAYNPYTEPSMEIFGYHQILKKWTEIGNSGVFRPEMLRPMGLPDDLVVLGWGLSLERPTMISRNVRDIRQLFGHRSKLNVF